MEDAMDLKRRAGRLAWGRGILELWLADCLPGAMDESGGRMMTDNRCRREGC